MPFYRIYTRMPILTITLKSLAVSIQNVIKLFNENIFSNNYINLGVNNMLSRQDFVRDSLELNLFFLRIIKEHFIILQASLFPKNKELMNSADIFKEEFSRLLKNTVALSQGVITPIASSENEFVTPYTLRIEELTQFATGIPIDTSITIAESSLLARNDTMNMMDITSMVESLPLEEQVSRLNDLTIRALNMVIQAKSKVVEDVLSCNLFTHAYPSLLEHVLEEAVYYLELLEKLQAGTPIYTDESLIDKEHFWNHIMSEHAYFIRGLLDPSEEDLFDIAYDFGDQFSRLTEETSDPDTLVQNLSELTESTLQAVTGIRDFKEQAVNGILDCRIRSIIIPLLSDHVLREANHYLKILKPSNKM